MSVLGRLALPWGVPDLEYVSIDVWLVSELNLIRDCIFNNFWPISGIDKMRQFWKKMHF